MIPLMVLKIFHRHSLIQVKFFENTIPVELFQIFGYNCLLKLYEFLLFVWVHLIQGSEIEVFSQTKETLMVVQFFANDISFLLLNLLTTQFLAKLHEQQKINRDLTEIFLVSLISFVKLTVLKREIKSFPEFLFFYYSVSKKFLRAKKELQGF